MSKFVEIKANGIFCISVDGDPGDDLEIYGSLFGACGFYDSRGIRQQRQGMALFQRDPDNYIEISGNSLFRFQSGNVFQCAIAQGDYIEFGGQLAENDTISNEEMGHYTTVLPYDQVSTNNYNIVFDNGHGETVQAEFTITVLGQF